MDVLTHLRKPRPLAFALAGSVIIGVLIWQGVTQHGVPDAAPEHLGRGTVILNSGILVLREGLEVILVLAAITASMQGANASYRRPVAAGAGLALVATIATWFVAVAVIGAVNAPALNVQAATGLLAIAVLLVVMNWFFHKVYWTGWISHHNRRRQQLLAHADDDGRTQTLLGLILLGFTAMYREGFEVVLFLQNLRLQAGNSVVLQGVALGIAFTIIVGALTFVLHRRLPYKKMLVACAARGGGEIPPPTGPSNRPWAAPSRNLRAIARRARRREMAGLMRSRPRQAT